jgi:DNA modification methylase
MLFVSHMRSTARQHLSNVVGNFGNFGINMRPYYQDNFITLYNGNNLDVMESLAPIDVIITDPPYGVGKAEWDISFPTAWIEHAFKISQKVLCMCGNSALSKACAAFGERYQDCIALYAVNGMTRSKVAFGNWFPAIVAGNWKWEARPNCLPFAVAAQIHINHPSPKPLQAMKNLLRYYTKENEIILDCFSGSGSTLLAAKEMGRKAIGIEIEKKYCDVAIERLSQCVMEMGAEIAEVSETYRQQPQEAMRFE